MLRSVLSFLFACAVLACHAADSLRVIRTIPMEARLMSIDDLGNVYVVRKDNCLLRYTENGDSSGFYKSVLNGDIKGLDVTNPLRVLVYSPGYSKVVQLDRMLVFKNELDLRKLNIYNAPVVANSADGNLWVYDQFNARLRKINEDLQEVAASNDLRQEVEMVPSPSYLVERERKAYLCDTTKGILVFDQYGTYINTLPLYNVKQLQVFGTQAVYRHSDTLYSYDMRRFTTNVLMLPGQGSEIINAALSRKVLYLLYNDRLVLYRMPEEQ